MKAIILAAGKGTRLKQLSEKIPKPMLKYKDKPLLEHNINLCKKYNINDIYINTHHLSSNIKEYFQDGQRWGVSITYSYEDKLLGTAGGVRNFRQNIDNDSFFVIYGDNYSNINLYKLIERKEKLKEASCIIAFHYRNDVSESGVAEFDENNQIIKFIEKPKEGQTESHWVNAGIYYCSHKIFAYIPDGFSDFGKDIFPRMLKMKEKIYGVCLDSDVLAFDTISMYKESIKMDYK